MYSFCEYIWVDGAKPTAQLRSKTKVMQFEGEPSISDFSTWSYDGSSTYQSEGGNSDLELRPVNFVKDPIRGSGNFLVMCEVYDDEGHAHTSNTRARLRKALEEGGQKLNLGLVLNKSILFEDDRPYGWPEGGYPYHKDHLLCHPRQVYGREIVEAYESLC